MRQYDGGYPYLQEIMELILTDSGKNRRDENVLKCHFPRCEENLKLGVFKDGTFDTRISLFRP